MDYGFLKEIVKMVIATEIIGWSVVLAIPNSNVGSIVVIAGLVAVWVIMIYWAVSVAIDELTVTWEDWRTEHFMREHEKLVDPDWPRPEKKREPQDWAKP